MKRGECLLAVVALAVLAGCAGTQGGGDIPSDPDLIRKEIAEIDMDIQNAEEVLKGSRAELQVEDNQSLRNEIHSLEAEIAQLHSKKKALEERLRELEAAGQR